ncbi:MAG: PEP-CTERM sorting domain-containing protein [Phycisphaerales bacterium]|nr:PEP-CTERM sorting domain-containing protein [Phycisphaerales bacterium]
MQDHTTPARFPRSIIGVSSAVAVLVLGSVARATPPAITPIAVTGQSSTGPANARYRTMYEPFINNDGHVAFNGEYYTTSPSNWTQAIWSGHYTAPTLLVHENQIAPASEVGAGIRFSNAQIVGLNNRGQVALRSRLNGTPTVVESLWTTDATGFRVVMHTLMPTPLPNLSFGSLDGETRYRQTFNDAGKIGFYASVYPAATLFRDDGLWTGSPGNTTLQAFERDHLPGTPANAYMGYDNTIPFTPPIRMNHKGVFAFSGYVTNFGTGLWLGGPNDRILVAGTGTPAPGTSRLFAGVESFSLNNAGMVAFSTVLMGSPIQRGVWRGMPGQLSLVALQGNPAPMMPSGVMHGSISSVAINAAGSVAFYSRLTGPGINAENNQAIYLSGLTETILIAQSGTPAPGINSTFNNLSFYEVNANGVVAFIASTRAVGGDGLWAYDPSVGVVPVAVPGTLFEFSSGVFKTVATVRTAFYPASGSSVTTFPVGGEDGLPRALNDHGQLAFSVVFTDLSSGVYIAQVPAPASLVVMLVGLGGCSRRRRAVG